MITKKVIVLKNAVFLFLFITLISCSEKGEDLFGSLTGKITHNERKWPLVNVTVTISNLSGLTDSNGIYNIKDIPIGTQNIYIEHDQFLKYTDSIEIKPTKTELNIELIKGTLITSENYKLNETIFHIHLSPYFIEDDITIGESNYMDYDLTFKCAEDVRISVDEFVNIRGSDSQPLLFTNQIEGKPWGGLRISGKTQIENVLLENADTAICSVNFSSNHTSYPEVVLENTILRNNIHSCYIGINSIFQAIIEGTNIISELQDKTTFHGISFKDCQISTLSPGIDISNCTFDNCNIQLRDLDQNVFNIYECHFIQSEINGKSYNVKISRNNFIDSKELLWDLIIADRIEENYIEVNGTVDLTTDGSSGNYEFKNFSTNAFFPREKPGDTKLEYVGGQWVGFSLR